MKASGRSTFARRGKISEMQEAMQDAGGAQYNVRRRRPPRLQFVGNALQNAAVGGEAGRLGRIEYDKYADESKSSTSSSSTRKREGPREKLKGSWEKRDADSGFGRTG